MLVIYTAVVLLVGICIGIQLNRRCVNHQLFDAGSPREPLR